MYWSFRNLLKLYLLEDLELIHNVANPSVELEHIIVQAL
jgi:hypothetical protein